MSNPYRTTPIPPVPESPKPPILPDRGTEDHGVAVEHEPAIEPIPDYATEPYTVDVEPPEHEIPIVPVRIVEEDARDVRDWRANIFSVPVIATQPEPIRVAGTNPRRTRLFLRNNHASEGLVILRQRTDGSFTGYPLAAGATVEIFAETEVSVIHATAGAASVELAVLEEFRVSKGG